MLVSSLSAANKTNYANWYTYYRTRLLMMKTLAGQSFAPLTKNFRIGFSTVHDTGVDDTPTFLPIADFDTIPAGTSQKEKFFTNLYGIGADAAAVPPQFTPLRAALSKAGRMYAGKFFTSGDPPHRDPMQYSCQQNFTLLASDGYWNSPNDTTSYGPLDFNNVLPIGDRDGGATPRPLFDFFDRPNTLADVAMYYYETDLRKTPGHLHLRRDRRGPLSRCQRGVHAQRPRQRRGQQHQAAHDDDDCGPRDQWLAGLLAQLQARYFGGLLS